MTGEDIVPRKYISINTNSQGVMFKIMLRWLYKSDELKDSVVLGSVYDCKGQIEND